MRYVVFFGFALLTITGVHLYLWLRLVRDTGIPPHARVALGVALIVLALSLPASFFLFRVLSPGTSRLVLFPIYVWMGVMLLLLTLLLAGDLLRLGHWLVLRLSSAAPLEPGRRQAIARLIAGAAGVGVVGATALGIWNALSHLLIRRVRVELPNLPKALDGTRIAQITDLHLGPTLGREWLSGIVARVNALEPDLVAITGDLVDGRVAALRETVQPLAQLQARLGVFFVTGNHEYYSRAVEWCAHLPSLGIRVLRNERVAVGGEASFDLCGIDDFNARGMAPGHGADLPRALAGRDPSRALVLLAHQPRAIHEAARHGVGLVLSGHTHGGQLWPWNHLVLLQQPVIAGLARFGETTIYVSEGTGFWGPPIRLGTRSEITLVTLAAPSRG
jgi:predicted MPP superfamily phosphohydrolase